MGHAWMEKTTAPAVAYLNGDASNAVEASHPVRRTGRRGSRFYGTWMPLVWLPNKLDPTQGDVRSAVEQALPPPTCHSRARKRTVNPVEWDMERPLRLGGPGTQLRTEHGRPT